jgi:hypothetical protein
VKPPIIVEEDRLVYLFSSAEEVEGKLEAIDISRYNAWDADGTRLLMQPGEDGMVRLSEQEPDVRAAMEVVVGALTKARVTPNVEAGLPGLVQQATDHFMEAPISWRHLVRRVLRLVRLSTK